MASMIYDMNKNGTNGVGYNSYDESNLDKKDRHNTLHSHFVSTRFVPKEKGKKEKSTSEPKEIPLSKPSRL